MAPYGSQGSVTTTMAEGAAEAAAEAADPPAAARTTIAGDTRHPGGAGP